MDRDENALTWADVDPPMEQLNSAVREKALLWPGWPWQDVLDYGMAALKRGENARVAVETAEVRYRMSRGAVRRFWLQAGLLRVDAR